LFLLLFEVILILILPLLVHGIGQGWLVDAFCPAQPFGR
jgi:hypothetical protein